MKTKGGAIIPATVVTGRKVVQGPAMRVYNAASSPRLVKGGPSEPVIVVDEDDIVGLGGKYRIMGGPAVPMVNLSSRKVKGGAAIPVYPVDASGAYDSSFAGVQEYYERVLALNPIRYWPLWDAAGLAAEELVVGDDGTYNGPTLGQPGIGDGRTCPRFDGSNDYCDIHSVAYNAAINLAEGSLHIWAKVFNVGIWTDAAGHACTEVYVDGSNHMVIRKSTVNNRLEFLCRRNAITDDYSINGVVEVDWMALGFSWSVADDDFRVYYGGVYDGRSITIGAMAGNLDNNWNAIGCTRIAPFAFGWNGWLAHLSVFDYPVGDANFAILGSV